MTCVYFIDKTVKKDLRSSWWTWFNNQVHLMSKKIVYYILNFASSCSKHGGMFLTCLDKPGVARMGNLMGSTSWFPLRAGVNQVNECYFILKWRPGCASSAHWRGRLSTRGWSCARLPASRSPHWPVALERTRWDSKRLVCS